VARGLASGHFKLSHEDVTRLREITGCLMNQPASIESIVCVMGGLLEN